MTSSPNMVLEATQSTSKVFYGRGTDARITIDTHAGGIWELQAMSPAGNWITVNDSAFSDNGVWGLHTVSGEAFRFTGGTVGAQIWVSGVNL